MKALSHNELATLSLGAAVLGSGGGGDPSILYGQLHYLLKKNGPVRLMKPDELAKNALVVPLALIGAPLVSMERLPNSAIFLALLRELRKRYPSRELVLAPAEIGGCNALTPFMLAAQASLPVLDADLIGRAFPELQMCKPAVLGKKQQTLFLANHFGACSVAETASLNELEERARALTVESGGSALLATFIFEAREREAYLVPNTLGRAYRLGQLLEKYSRNLSGFAMATQARVLGSGLIADVCHVVQNGFLIGYAEIRLATQKLRIYYKNEYLLVLANKEFNQPMDGSLPEGAIVAESPELIVLVDARSGLPLASEVLRFGLQVQVLSLPAPHFWQEPQARALVSLAAFGLIQKKRCANV